MTDNIRVIVTHPDGRQEDITNSITSLDFTLLATDERMKKVEPYLDVLHEITSANRARYYASLQGTPV